MSLAESTLGAVSRVGPYFSAVSLIPAGVLVASSYIAIRLEPWSGQPRWGSLALGVASMGWEQVALGILVTVLVAFLLHPFQFAHVQLLEGYWGDGRLALRVGSLAVRAHLETLERALQGQQDAMDQLETLGAEDYVERASLTYRFNAHEKQISNYPESFDDLMPTRLGNVLRRYERGAGYPYNLDAITAVPLLGLVAPADQLAYLNDQRTQMDLAARFSTVFAILSVEWLCLFLPTGWWVLIGAGAYGLSWLFYRGAASLAHLYGSALTSLVDLNRLEMYRKLGMPATTSVAAERTQNVALGVQLGERARDFDYPLRMS